MTTTHRGGHPAQPSWRTAATRTVPVEGTEFAYRDLGPANETPLVLLNHLAAVLDNWDPRMVEGLASKRRVIAFDNRGVGASGGKAPGTVTQMAQDAAAFIRALELEQVDLLGFSLGGMVAQELVRLEPSMVRRMILAGTSPAGAVGVRKVPRITFLDIARGALTRQDPKQFLFFPRTPQGRGAGKNFLERLNERTDDRDKDISVPAFLAQLRAIKRWANQRPADLSGVHQPVLAVNGDADRMVPSEYTSEIGRRLPNCEVVLYPDAGHGAIFQFHDDFIARVLRFVA